MSEFDDVIRDLASCAVRLHDIIEATQSIVDNLAPANESYPRLKKKVDDTTFACINIHKALSRLKGLDDDSK